MQRITSIIEPLQLQLLLRYNALNKVYQSQNRPMPTHTFTLFKNNSREIHHQIPNHNPIQVKTERHKINVPKTYAKPPPPMTRAARPHRPASDRGNWDHPRTWHPTRDAARARAAAGSSPPSAAPSSSRRSLRSSPEPRKTCSARRGGSRRRQRHWPPPWTASEHRSRRHRRASSRRSCSRWTASAGRSMSTGFRSGWPPAAPPCDRR